MTKKVKVRRRGHTRVSSKHQVTLPVAALAQAHIGVGDELRVEVEGDGSLRLIRAVDPLEALIGSMPGLERATNLQALRDEWER